MLPSRSSLLIPKICSSITGINLSYREDRIAYITRYITEYKGDRWYFRRYLMANLLTGLIICSQVVFLHSALGITIIVFY